MRAPSCSVDALGVDFMGLRERRIAAGYETVAELSEATGMSYQRIWRLECGRAYIQLINGKDKHVLADALGCDVRVFNYRPVKVADCKTEKRDPVRLDMELKRKYGRKLLPIDHSREHGAYCFQEPHLYENF